MAKNVTVSVFVLFITYFECLLRTYIHSFPYIFMNEYPWLNMENANCLVHMIPDLRHNTKNHQ
jgi:hypothetical protein